MNSKSARFSHWQQIMKDYEQSGLTQEKFCTTNNLSFRQFKYYRYQIHKEEKSSAPTSTVHSTFTPITFQESIQPNTKAVSPSIFEIKLPNGITINLDLLNLPLNNIKPIIQELMSC